MAQADFLRSGPGPVAAALPQAPRRRLGEILLDRGILDAGALSEGLAAQEEMALRLGEVLVARRLASRDAVTAALAEQWSIGRLDLAGAAPEPRLLAAADPVACLAALCIPWRRIGRTTVVAIADPARAEEATAAVGPVEGRLAFALAEPAAIRAAIARGFRDALRERARTRTPARLSCRTWARRAPAAALLLLGLAAALLALAGAVPVLAGLLAFAVLSNLATTLLRATALALSFAETPRRTAPGVTPLARFRRRPLVSLLVPLYRETAVLTPLLGAMARIDYPAELLDIVLVIEEDDEPMANALAARSLPPHVRVLPVPADRLRTKPRAMNYALDFASGEIVGVYDAEDVPDPAQVADVVRRFAESPGEVACVQARLGHYNVRQNWLARCFAIEYATWFEVLLPGVQRLGLPVPLGGTSVFFRRTALEAAGAWDAHNVTEDADLGMRLARMGYRTEVIGSTTLEEANCRPMAWVRQRSRWLKGYLVTWITHMRTPRRLWRELGPRGFLGLNVLLLGGATAYLALPLLWIGWAWSLVAGSPPWVAALPGPLLDAFWLSLLAGQAVMVGTSARALARTGQTGLLPWLLTLPLYWPLGALAAYRAVWDLATAPFHWHKTEHGLAPRAMAEAAGGHEPQPVRPASTLSRVT